MKSWSFFFSLEDGTTETKSYPFKGNDMTMQIQDFIDDVKNGKVQSEKHCLADKKKILEVSEMIAVSQNS